MGPQVTKQRTFQAREVRRSFQLQRGYRGEPLCRRLCKKEWAFALFLFIAHLPMFPNLHFVQRKRVGLIHEEFLHLRQPVAIACAMDSINSLRCIFGLYLYTPKHVSILGDASPKTPTDL